MNQDLSGIDKERLQNLMQQAGIADLNELSQRSRVPKLQLLRIQQGLIRNIALGSIAKIAQTLDISIDSLLTTFIETDSIQESPPAVEPKKLNSEREAALAACRQEYEKLEQSMTQLEQRLKAEFQQESLTTIESWLLQWPTAATAVRQNPQLPATRLLSLVEPVEQLIQQWNVTTIASVGEELAYDPQNHQLMKGTAEPGEMVKVRYVGYRKGEKLLHKAKVSPV